MLYMQIVCVKQSVIPKKIKLGLKKCVCDIFVTMLATDDYVGATVVKPSASSSTTIKQHLPIYMLKSSLFSSW